MSQHKADLIHKMSLSNGAIAVLMRCCGDLATDQWHTLQVGPETTPEKIQGFLARAKKSCEEQHAALEQAHAIIEQGLEQ